MRLAIQLLAYLVGLPLELMVIGAMLRGAYRQYPFVFLYVIVDFLTTVLEIQPGLAYDGATVEQKRVFARMYWWDERVIQVMVFLVVISLVYRATAQWRPRRTMLFGIIMGTLAFAAITFFIHFDPTATTVGHWMTRWTRDLNFCAAILDLLLWAALIRARERDYRVLMVSGALGIQFTGGAIAQALRGISYSTVAITADLIAVANIACLYIWWQAFRAAPERPKRQISDVTHSSTK